MTRGAGSSSRGLPTDWLRKRCERVLSNSGGGGGGITARELAASILTTLMDSRSEAELQEPLFEALHFDFEAVSEVMQHRTALLHDADAILADCTEESYIPQRAEPERQRRPGAKKNQRRRRGPSMKEDLNPTSSYQDPSTTAIDIHEREFGGIGMGDHMGIGYVDKLSLPEGTERTFGDGYEEFFIPPPAPQSNVDSVPRVSIQESFDDRPEFVQAMRGITSFNQLQSSVFPIAYNSNENMLVCAPTGAGKTNVALLTVFQQINAKKSGELKNFKIVYVAPMKALAAEVVEKFGKKLGPLGITVREFTGDMRLSYREANETHILVTTPEKWDVVTRKSSSSLSTSVTLLILDEVHLLHDDRGAVLESIIARTLRFSESTQKKIRLVGLSATLPNYKDVAEFLRVDENKGLFHFGSGFRPVPLQQNFAGVTEGEGSSTYEARQKKSKKFSELTWWKVKDSLQRGHQAMVFVHSRKQTVSSARELLAEANEDCGVSIFLPQQDNPDYTGKHDEATIAAVPSWALDLIAKSRSTDVRELCPKGIGIHHAGMQRPDRKLVERLFEKGAIRVLCCTATLAWGVNLPARTVVIKGTEVYNADKGRFEQIGILDVKQIFGRAGRPQYDTLGEGHIITMHEHLANYLSKLLHAKPIESTIGHNPSKLADHLNPEIVSGTVTTLGEAVKWLNYTFLSVRMPKNPLPYGCTFDDVKVDPGLHQKRANLLREAAHCLDDMKMCRFDPRSGALASTELGRVCSYSYVSHRTLERWNEILGKYVPPSSDEETNMSRESMEILYGLVLEAVSSASEFEQIRSRNEELIELDKLRKSYCPVPMKSTAETREGKVSILIQAHICGANVRLSDLSYVVQSCSRLLRALFEVALLRGLQGITLAALDLARAADTRIWPFDHPLTQFSIGPKRGTNLVLQREIVYNIREQNRDLESLKMMSNDELSEVVRVPRILQVLKKCIYTIPVLTITDVSVGPVSRTLFRFRVTLRPDFKWNEAHGEKQSWWFWIEDQRDCRIYFSERLTLNKSQVQKFNEHLNTNSDQANGQELQSSPPSRCIEIDLLVPVYDPPARKYWVRVESEYWHTGGGSVQGIGISSMHLPRKSDPKTQLLDLRPIPVDASVPANIAETFPDKITHLYPVQTQLFDQLYNSSANMFVGVPLGSGKTVLAELALFRAFVENAGKEKFALYLVQSEKLASRRYYDWKERFGTLVFPRIVFLTMENAKSNLNIRDSLVIATPNSWYELTKAWSATKLMDMVSAVIIDELHLVGSPKGHELEFVVTKMRNASAIVEKLRPNTLERCRFIGLSASVSCSVELADWLGVKSDFSLNFDDGARTIPCTVDVMGVPEDKYVHRMQAMNKLVYGAASKVSSPTGINVIVFTSSAREAMHTARAVVRHSELDQKPSIFVGNPIEERQSSASIRNVSDPSVRNLLAKGIAVCHSGMHSRDRETTGKFFEDGRATLLIATFEASWGINKRSALVIVKGTEVFSSRYERFIDLSPSEIFQMIGKAGRPLTDVKCNALILLQERKKPLVKKFMGDSLSVESQLAGNFTDHMLKLISTGGLKKQKDVGEFLMWSLFLRKVFANPSYYGARKLGTDNDQVMLDREFKAFAQDFTNRSILEAYTCNCLVSTADSNGAQASSSNSTKKKKKSRKAAERELNETYKMLPKNLELSRLGQIFVDNRVKCRSGKMMWDRLVASHDVSSVVVDAICECAATEDIAMDVTEELVNQIVDNLPLWYLTSVSGKSGRKEALDKLEITGLTGRVANRLRVVYHGHMSGYSGRNMEFRSLVQGTLASMLKYGRCGFLLSVEAGMLKTGRNFAMVIQALDQGYLPTSPVSSAIDVNTERQQRECNNALKRDNIERVDAFLKDRERTRSLLRKYRLNRDVIKQLNDFLDGLPVLTISDAKLVEQDDDGSIVECTVEARWSNEMARRVQRQRHMGSGTVLCSYVEEGGDSEKVYGATTVQLADNATRWKVEVKTHGLLPSAVATTHIVAVAWGVGCSARLGG